MKICDLISELQRFNPNDHVGVEITPQDFYGSSLHGLHPEPDALSILHVEPNGGGDKRVCKIILDSND